MRLPLSKRGYALWINSEIMALRLLIVRLALCLSRLELVSADTGSHFSQGKRTFRLAQALVIIVHYAVLAITALFWVLLWAKSIPCQAVLWSIWTIYVAVWAVSNGVSKLNEQRHVRPPRLRRTFEIFLLRIHALYNRRRKVMRFFFVVYFFGLLLWVSRLLCLL